MDGQDKLDDQMTIMEGQAPSQARPQSAEAGLDDAATMVVEPAPDSAAGRSPSDRFEILDELGRGGMGVVYKARDKKLGRVIALKSLRPESAASAKTVERFWREAKAIASLNHFNIVGIYDVLEQGQALWIAMEYLPGGSLKDKVKQGPLAPKEVAKIGRQLADAVDHAHSRGIYHRDIKPGNVLLTERGTPKLGDFGLAQEAQTAGDMTVHGAMMGTMYFASPEQMADGSNVDARSDVYSLGATLYTLATGEIPRAIRLDRVPEQLRGVIGKCLEEHPEKRFQSAAELAQALATGAFAPEPEKKGQACPSCGHFNPDKLRFCQKCGTGLASLFRKCPKCRADNHVDVEFCGECGENIPVALLVLEARNATSNGLPQEAARAWKAILAKDPSHPDAKANLERIVANNKRIKELAALAKDAYKNGDKESAYKFFCDILAIDPALEEAKKHCEAMKPALVQQRLGRAKAFFAVKKYDKAYNQLQGVIELDEFNRDALDLLTAVSRFYKPSAPKVQKTLAMTPMGLSRGRKVNKKVVMIVCMGVLAAFFALIMSMSGTGDNEPLYDQQAQLAASKVAQAVQSLVRLRPDEPVTVEAIKALGVAWAPVITVFVDNPDPQDLQVRVMHLSGKHSYVVDHLGVITEEVLNLVPDIAIPSVPAPSPDDILEQ